MRGYACIGLDNPKINANIGGVLRAAEIFNARFVAISGHRYKKASTDTFKHIRHLPLLQVDDLRMIIPYDCIPIAVELKDDAKSIHEFEHPERAFYIFGGEDATLGERILSWCREVIYVPSNGCLNLAACVNVVLYDRSYKEWLNK